MPEETPELPVSPRAAVRQSADSGDARQEVQIQAPSLLDKIKIHKFKILGGVLGVLVFIGAVFGAYKLGQRQVQPPGLVVTPTPLPSEAPAKEGDPTADWKTYTDQNDNYSIKYPPAWSVTPSQFFSQTGITKAARLEGEGLEVLINVFKDKPAESDLSYWISSLVDETGKRNVFWEKEIVVNGIKSIQQEISSAPLGRSVRVYVPRSSTAVFEFTAWPVGDNDPSKPIDLNRLNSFNLILSTFKFLE